MTSELIQAIKAKGGHPSKALAAGTLSPKRIMFLPEGTHTIDCSVNGKPGTRTVTVGRSTLSRLQASLSNRLSRNVRPFGGFDHKEGAASFIPKSFSYEAGRGVMLEVEWTRAGSEALAGKDYSYFSPSIMVHNGEVVSLPAHGEIGSLVNDPAFQAIERIAAAKAEPQLFGLDRYMAATKSVKVTAGATTELEKDLGKIARKIGTPYRAIHERLATSLPGLLKRARGGELRDGYVSPADGRARGAAKAVKFLLPMLEVFVTGAVSGREHEEKLKAAIRSLMDGARAKAHGDIASMGEFDQYKLVYDRL